MKKNSLTAVLLLTSFSVRIFAHDCPTYLSKIDYDRVRTDLQQMQDLAAAGKYSSATHGQFVNLAKDGLETQSRAGVTSADFTSFALSVIESARLVSGEVRGQFVTTLTDVAPLIRNEASNLSLRASDIKRLKEELYRSYIPGKFGRRLYVEVETWDWGMTAEQREQERQAYAALGKSPIETLAQKKSRD